MRGSAVLSLALLVALPSWAAAQVITLLSEPGFGFRDTPPTVPASRLIPQAMADTARLSDFRATVDLSHAFSIGTDLSRVPIASTASTSRTGDLTFVFQHNNCCCPNANLVGAVRAGRRPPQRRLTTRAVRCRRR